MTVNLGVKRTCVACAAKFYDLGKNPSKCPKCGTVNDSTIIARKRGRAKVSAADSDDPLLKEKAKMESRQAKAKKPTKVEGVDLDAFEDIEPIASDDDIEEIEEEDITLESLEELDEGDDESIEEEGLEKGELGDEVLIDEIEEEDLDEDEDEEDEEDEDDDRPAKKSSAKKPAPKPAAKKAPAKKPEPKKPAKKR